MFLRLLYLLLYCLYCCCLAQSTCVTTDPYGHWPIPYTAFVLFCQFLGLFSDLGSVGVFDS